MRRAGELLAKHNDDLVPLVQAETGATQKVASSMQVPVAVSRFDRYARELLSTIEASQSWGIPAIARPEFNVYFKGGWLPEEGVVNQAGRLERPRITFAMALLSTGDPSMAYGEETIAGVTAWLLGLAS